MDSFELNTNNIRPSDDINPSKLRERPVRQTISDDDFQRTKTVTSYPRQEDEYTTGERQTGEPRQNVRQAATPKEENRTATESNQTRQRVPGEEKHEFATSMARFFGDGRLRIFFGIALILVAGVMLVASLSYLSHYSSDQSVVINNTASNISANPQPVENTAGWLGALMSHLLMHRWLGLGGFIIIFYIAALGISMVKLHHFRFWQLTFKSLVAAIAVSVIAGLLTYSLVSPEFWGGEHGYWVNHGLISATSYWGAGAVSILLASALVLIFIGPLKTFINHTRSLMAKQKQSLAHRYNSSMAAARAAMHEERPTTADKKTASAYNPDDEIIKPEPTDTVSTEAEYEPTVTPTVTIVRDPDTDTRITLTDIETPANQHDNDREISSQAPTVTINEHYASVSPARPTVSPTQADRSETAPTETPAHQLSDIEPVNTSAGQAIEAIPSSDIPTPAKDEQPKIEVKQPVIEESDDIDISAYDPTAELSRYRFPDIDLLDIRENSFTLSEEEQEENNQRIISTLGAYGIKIESIKATVGPTITLYEIVPEKGTRISAIKRLGDDMALSLSAIGIRIIAPIPGKGTIGMEVPNKKPQIVGIRSILSSKAYHESTAQLPIALGTTIDNEVYVTDLAKMPHLLVAGATGMGKSVGLNTIIASLVYKKHPAELKFVLVDPKMVEFSLYKSLERHFLAKLPDEEEAIITDPQKVVATLNSLCLEMDNRYRLLSEAGMRGIKEYNQKFISRRLNPEKGHRYLPYIVVIIDEFADLILTAGKEVETPISRIAAKARAVGIHMILATQRPSVNVITGVIKANFPGRMAFRVTQMNDSRTILDRPGAEQLVGRGDMLISRDGVIDRVQCAFIDTDEVESICKSISDQMGYPTAYELPEELPVAGEGYSGANIGDRDTMFADAGRAVIEAGMGSASLLQRKFNIGYPRAGKLIDQLEAAGVVGASTGAGKPRPVLMDSYSFERMLEG